MLTKKQLRMIKLPTLYKKQYGNLVWSDTNTFIVRSRIEKRNNVLVVAFYSVKYPDKKPVYTLYLTQNDSVTLDRSDFYDIDIKTNYHQKRDLISPKEKWRTGCLSSYVNSYSNINYGSKQDHIRICKFLGKTVSDDTPLGLIDCYQFKQKEKLRRSKKAKRLQEINRLMKSVPAKLPKGFEKWVNKVPLLKSRYIVYVRQTAKKASGYCTHCKKEVDLSHLIPKHMEINICPSCKSDIQFLARGKMKHHWTDEAFCSISRRTKDNQGIVFSFYEIYKYYQKDSIENPEVTIHERYRVFTDLYGKITGYYRQWRNSYTDTYSWFPTDFHKLSGNTRYHYSYAMYYWKLYSCYEEQCIYPYNLKNVLHGTLYQQRLSDLLVFTKKPGDVLGKLENLQAMEMIEKLEKVGLTKFAEWFLNTDDSCNLAQKNGMNFDARRLHRKMGLLKQEYRMFVENNFSMEEYECIKEFKNTKEFKQIVNRPEQVSYLSKVGKEKWNVVKKILQHTTLNKIIRYITSNYEQDEYGYYTDIWNDYLEMCSKLEIATWYPKILFPENLQDEHDKIMYEIKEQTEGNVLAKIEKRYPKLHKEYEYEDCNYIIVAPRNYSDIAREAKRLNNCLISNAHYKRHAEKQSTLLFLRKKENPDAAFFCFSINDKDEITSIEGYQEKQYATPTRIRPSDAENGFLEKWQHNKCSRYAKTHSFKRAA